MPTLSTGLPLLHRGRSLVVRRTAPEDAALLFKQMYQNPDFMRLFRLNDAIASEHQLAERLTRRLQVDPAQSGYLELLLIHKQKGPIGVVALADYAPLHRHTELLIGLFAAAHRHHSYGLEGCLLVGDLVFNQYGLHRLYAYTYQYNHYAQKSLEAGGFVLEGVMQEHVFDSATQQFINLHVYGMTAPQFRQNARLARLAQRLVGRDITQPLPCVSASPTPQKSQPRFVRSGPRQLGND
ncbi:MAG: GNAT family protein [Cyanobacteria bacterium J06559_3]